MLVGWGIVCIRRTAQRSTGEFGSCPFEGSRHRTNRSLHKIPYNGRGVNSGAKQSTATLEASPWESNTSNAIVCLRTIRVIRSFPSIIKRLMMKQIWRVSKMTERKKSMHKILHHITYLCGWTSGLGNLPLIRACHCTNFLRDSASRFPSFILVARDEISVTARSRGSS